jgi:hypothetical protein
MRFGLRKSAVTPVEDNTVLSQLMKGRDTRWYAGDLLKINLIIVRIFTPCSMWIDLLTDILDVPAPHFDE